MNKPSKAKVRKGNPVRVLIADDHPIMVTGISLVISSKKFSIVGVANDGCEALVKLQDLAPDLAILDLLMPGISGLEITKEIRKRGLKTKVILLTSVTDDEIINTALSDGVDAYVLKEYVVDELLSAVKTVMGGKKYVSGLIAKKILRNTGLYDKKYRPLWEIERLSAMEKKVLLLLPAHKTSKKIASALNLSTLTVQNHRANICQKLGISGYNALLTFAVENKSLLI